MVINSPSQRSGLRRSHAPSQPRPRLPVAPSPNPPRPIRPGGPAVNLPWAPRNPPKPQPHVPRMPRGPGRFGWGPAAVAGVAAGFFIYWYLKPYAERPGFEKSGSRVYFYGARYAGKIVNGVKVPAYYPPTPNPASHPVVTTAFPTYTWWFTNNSAWQSIYYPQVFLPGAPSHADYEARWAFDIPPFSTFKTAPPPVLAPPPVWWTPPPGVAPPPTAPSPGGWPGLYPPPGITPNRPPPVRRPATRPQPRPAVPPNLVLDSGPNGVTKPNAPPQRPPRGTKERKIRSFWGLVLNTLLDYGTEGVEAIEILLDGSEMPRDPDAGLLEELWTFFEGGYYENLTPEEIWDLYANQSEDRLYGQMFNDIADALREAGVKPPGWGG